MFTLDIYKLDASNVIATGIVKDSDIVDIDYQPLAEKLLQFYRYGKKYIDQNTYKFNLPRTYFLYHSLRSENAYALGTKDINVIFITLGLFSQLYNRLYLLNNSFSKESLFRFNKLIENSSYPLGELMFETALIFTFNHEFAHLIQNKGKSFMYEEVSNNLTEFSQYQHLKEYDSDLWGCNIAINTIEQYIFDYQNEFPEIDDKLNLHFLALSSIIITMLLFLNNFEFSHAEREIYFESKKHPHPSIRIVYIIEHYIYNLNESFKHTITFQDALNNCFKYCNEFFDGKDIFIDFFTQLDENLNEINTYCDKLYELSLATPNLIKHNYDSFVN